MCEFPSFLVQRNGNVIFDPKVNSHSTLAERNNISQDSCIQVELGPDSAWQLQERLTDKLVRERHLLFFSKMKHVKDEKIPESAFLAAQEFIKDTFYNRKNLKKLVSGTYKKGNEWGVLLLVKTVTGYKPEKYKRGKKRGRPKLSKAILLDAVSKKRKFNKPKFAYY